ncbi:unnamed protein product [Miscanthus lutarioriparius]|uniref:Uncharacterized protein n=1 Tax=Miscanthus lutarioriparius TaxID=422564 RepID=A0A811QG82_9POAL|nr:unnamed protein product [Miscanthus lutarioriparius]
MVVRVALPPSRRCVWLFLQASGARAALYLWAVARGPRPLPAAVRGPCRPSDAVTRLAAPRSGRQDAELAEKQRNPAVGQQHVHQVSTEQPATSWIHNCGRSRRRLVSYEQPSNQVPCNHAVNNCPRAFRVLWRAESLAEAGSSDWECRLPSTGDRVHNLKRSKLAPLLHSQDLHLYIFPF